MRLYTLSTLYFYSFEVNGQDWLPMPEVETEVISRKGLDNAVRSFGLMPGGLFQLRAKTFFATDAAFETALAALRVTQAAFTPLQSTRQRSDGTYFNYDTESVRYLLTNTENTKAIQAVSGRVLKVNAPGSPFIGAKTRAEFTFNLLPVIYSP